MSSDARTDTAAPANPEASARERCAHAGEHGPTTRPTPRGPGSGAAAVRPAQQSHPLAEAGQQQTVLPASPGPTQTEAAGRPRPEQSVPPKASLLRRRPDARDRRRSPAPPSDQRPGDRRRRSTDRRRPRPRPTARSAGRIEPKLADLRDLGQRRAPTEPDRPRRARPSRRPAHGSGTETAWRAARRRRPAPQWPP